MTEETSVNEVKSASGEASHALSPLAIFRHSSKLSAVNLLRATVIFVTNTLVARVLGPELLGVVGYVTLWHFYAGLIRPGTLSAAYREMPPLLARGKSGEAARVQNIGITSEAIYLLFPIAIIVIAGLFHENDLLRHGLIIIALVLCITQGRTFATMIQWAHQRFELIAKANALSTLVGAVFVVSTIWLLKVYTPLLALAVMAMTAIAYYWLAAPPSGFRLQLDSGETWRLLKIGLPLALGTVFYWGFRTVDRTAVTVWLTLTDLGYFTFIMQIINLAILLVSDFGNVVQPKLWGELGRVSNTQRLGSRIRNLSLVIMAVTSAGTNVGQAVFGAFTHWFVPQFTPTIASFEIFAFLLACGTAGIVPGHLLNSAAVNKQKLATAIWGLGVPINAGLVYLAVRAGWGLPGIALSSVVAQALISATLLFIVGGYLFTGRQGQLAFYGSMLGLLFITLIVFALFHLKPLSYAGSENVLQVAGLRLLLAGTVWGGIGGIIYLRRKARK